MANIQFGGLITGLDTNALIAGLVKAEQRSVDVLQAQKVRFRAQDGVFTSLISALGSLKSTAQGLSLANDFNKKSSCEQRCDGADRRRGLDGAYRLVQYSRRSLGRGANHPLKLVHQRHRRHRHRRAHHRGRQRQYDRKRDRQQ